MIALVGKYVDLPDAYLSVCEALRAGGFANRAKVVVRWVPSDACETPEGAPRALQDVDGVCIPGGFGIRGVEGKVGAIRYARENQIPILGSVPRPAVHGDRGRPAPGRSRAARTPRSSARRHPHPVIATMAEQIAIVSGEGDLGGSMRLGAYPAELQPGSLVAKQYGQTEVTERHRHRYTPSSMPGRAVRLDAPDRRPRGQSVRGRR